MAPGFMGTSTIGWRLLLAAVRNAGSPGINRRMVGTVVRHAAAPADAAAFRRFAAATRDPVYRKAHDADANAPAPPLYIAKLILPPLQRLLADPRLNMNLLRMVHAEQTVRWFASLRPGDAPEVTLTLRDVEDTPAGEKLVVTGRVDAEGRPIADGRAGLIVRAARAGKASRERAIQSVPAAAFSDVLRTDLRQPHDYAEASGDHNFIHTRPLLARLAGLPGNILHGFCVLAMACSRLTSAAAGGDYGRIREIHARFAAPALPGSELLLQGRYASESGTLSYTVTDASGKPVIRDGRFGFEPSG